MRVGRLSNFEHYLLINLLINAEYDAPGYLVVSCTVKITHHRRPRVSVALKTNIAIEVATSLA